MLDPADVTPMRTDPASITVDYRRRAHARRYDAQVAADTARTALLAALTANGTPADTAATLVDGLITTVRTADALRLEYARGIIRDDEHHGRDWDGISDLNGAVDFLYRSAHAYPVRPADNA
jgi:hypothetical protein